MKYFEIEISLGQNYNLPATVTANLFVKNKPPFVEKASKIRTYTPILAFTCSSVVQSHLKKPDVANNSFEKRVLINRPLSS